MKLTKQQLKRIIQEEISKLHGNYPEDEPALENWAEKKPGGETEQEEETVEARLERAQAAIKDIIVTEIPNLKSDIKRLQQAKGRQQQSSEKSEEGLEASVEELP